MIENNKKIPKKTLNFRALEIAFAIFAFFIGITFSAFVVANENIDASGDSIILKIEQIEKINEETFRKIGEINEKTLKSINKLAENLTSDNADLEKQIEKALQDNKKTRQSNDDLAKKLQKLINEKNNKQ